MDSNNCLFCFLKENKDNIIYENDHVYVILDRFPLSTCHLLIISKEHHVLMHECSEDILCEIIKTAKTIANKLKMEKYNICNNNVHNQIVKHVHFHLTEANESGNCDSTTRMKLSDEEYSMMAKVIRDKIV